MGSGIVYSVFTKPWKTPIPELGELIKGMGFDAIELPVRPDYRVEPENVQRDLPGAVGQLAACGVQVVSVAGPTDEPTIRACGECGVPIIRICPRIEEIGYLATEEKLWREFDALVPLLDECGVAIGIQNHCNEWISSSAGVRRLIERYDPSHVCAVWDPAHNALAGEVPELAIDLSWSHLRMVNLKSACWLRANGPEAEVAQWKLHWTTGRQGIAPWPKVVSLLKQRGWEGPVCLTAEYSDHEATDRLIRDDIAYARSLFETQ